MAGSILSLPFTRRCLPVILLLFCLIIFLAPVQFITTHVRPGLSHSVSHNSPKPGADSHCNKFKSPSDIVVIVKTGANVIFQKLPTQLLTSLRCVPDLLVFSDLEQDIGSLHVYNALDNVTEAAMLSNSDFDYYRMLQEQQKYGQDISKIKSGIQGWNLDKYKFLHILERTWNMRPGRKWYILVEADTYLVWTNLVLWLERLNSTESLYLGSPAYLNGESFAHGGSGIILSGAALARFADGDPGVASRYDGALKNEKYGDYMLMKALRDKGVELSNRWPMIQGEKPRTIPFGPGPDSGVRHWCQPIVTMHHVTPVEASEIYNLEKQRPHIQQPLLIHELFDGFFKPHLTSELKDWDNLSDDLIYWRPAVPDGKDINSRDLSPVQRDAYLSFDHCRRACEEAPRCFQYLYHDETCGFSYSYRLGGRRAPEDNYLSGWNLRKIALDQAANGCHSPEWL